MSSILMAGMLMHKVGEETKNCSSSRLSCASSSMMLNVSAHPAIRKRMCVYMHPRILMLRCVDVSMYICKHMIFVNDAQRVCTSYNMYAHVHVHTCTFTHAVLCRHINLYAYRHKRVSRADIQHAKARIVCKNSARSFGCTQQKPGAGECFLLSCAASAALACAELQRAPTVSVTASMATGHTRTTLFIHVATSVLY